MSRVYLKKEERAFNEKLRAFVAEHAPPNVRLRYNEEVLRHRLRNVRRNELWLREVEDMLKWYKQREETHLEIKATHNTHVPGSLESPQIYAWKNGSRGWQLEVNVAGRGNFKHDGIENEKKVKEIAEKAVEFILSLPIEKDS